MRAPALLPYSYVEAVQRAGGLALMLPPDPAVAADPDPVLDLLDGLLLAGGADVDPATYGAEPHPATDDGAPERDAFELALAARAMERDLPFLGVCRGMQVMNVARGGTLNQHLPDDLGHEDHRRSPGTFDNDTTCASPPARSPRAPPARRCTPPSRTTTRASSASATGSRSPAGRRSTSCPRRSRCPGTASRSASSGIRRPTRARG